MKLRQIAAAIASNLLLRMGEFMRIALFGTAIWLSAADASNAQNGASGREFIYIPPQTLSSALRELGKERGLQIVYALKSW
jgi:hypothetical protein